MTMAISSPSLSEQLQGGGAGKNALFMESNTKQTSFSQVSHLIMCLVEPTRTHLTIWNYMEPFCRSRRPKAEMPFDVG